MTKELIRRDVSSNKYGVVATIIENADGGPMRPIATGRSRRVVGSYYSFKCGYACPWESRNELLGLYHAEVRFDVVKYRTQPHTLEMISNGQRYKFTPDLELQLAAGRLEIIEIKGDFDAIADPAYSAKLTLAREVYRSIGMVFRIVTRAELEAQPRLRAIEEIQTYRRTAITPGDTMILAKLFKASGTVTVGDIKHAYGNAIVGMAKTYAMMVRRIVDIDISKGLSDQSTVRLPVNQETVGA